MTDKKTEALKLALKRAFNLGQTYWQQADSEYTSQWKKADVTLASFNQLVEDTIREALAEQPAPGSHLTDEQKAVNGLAWLARLEALREEWAGLAEQPAQQEPVACKTLCELCVKRGYHFCANAAQTTPIPSPPASKPLFKEFIKWAGAQGYDCAQTCNSDTGEWICLNPMTADLWKAWQAAHSGVKGDA